MQNTAFANILVCGVMSGRHWTDLNRLGLGELMIFGRGKLTS